MSRVSTESPTERYVCPNVYLYNYNAEMGLRTSFKLDYNNYLKNYDRVHKRIGESLSDKYGHFDPLRLLEKITLAYDDIRTNPKTSEETLKITQQFLVYAYINFIKMSSVWEAPIEKPSAHGIHMIVCDWKDPSAGFMARSCHVESRGMLRESDVLAGIVKEMQKKEAAEHFKSLSKVMPDLMGKAKSKSSEALSI
ncbi:hypothetical protein ACI2KR_31970 [Pseudomonas luteola]